MSGLIVNAMLQRMPYDRSPRMMTFLTICFVIGLIFSLMCIGADEKRRKRRSRSFTLTGGQLEEIENIDLFLESWDIQDHLEELEEEE